jgi:hypothetical protein
MPFFWPFWHLRSRKSFKNRLYKLIKTNGTDNHLAVFTKYLVAEYSAGHYSAEYSADRIVGRSLDRWIREQVNQFGFSWVLFTLIYSPACWPLQEKNKCGKEQIWSVNILV